MNYYERHLGDYARDTAHLSMLEHGAYTLLLDRIYATEQPIPADQVHRVARARSREERAAVDAVLREFFTEGPDGWSQTRCDREIARFRESAPAREAKRENERERQRRARERRSQMFETLRSHGIVPAFDAPISELQQLMSRVTKTDVTQPVTRDVTVTQTPDSIHHINPPTPLGGRAVAGFPPGFDRFWSAYPRKTAKATAAKAFARLKPDEPLQAAILAALATQAASAQWTRDGGQFVPHAATWLNGRRWEDQPGTGSDAVEPWHETRAGIEAKAVELGIGKWDQAEAEVGRAEQWPSYRRRVFAAAGHEPVRAA